MDIMIIIYGRDNWLGAITVLLRAANNSVYCNQVSVAAGTAS